MKLPELFSTEILKKRKEYEELMMYYKMYGINNMEYLLIKAGLYTIKKSREYPVFYISKELIRALSVTILPHDIPVKRDPCILFFEGEVRQAHFCTTGPVDCTQCETPCQIFYDYARYSHEVIVEPELMPPPSHIPEEQTRRPDFLIFRIIHRKDNQGDSIPQFHFYEEDFESRLVDKVLTYINMPKADLIFCEQSPEYAERVKMLTKSSNPKSQKRAQARVNELKNKTRVGYRVRYINRHTQKEIKEVNTNPTREVSPHWRRGHFRNQWYGSGESRESKTIWIAPTGVKFPKNDQKAVYKVI